ncbi:adenylate/guanylate cyclase domain-containing protein [Inquilinus sp. CA228]|uniref:adenylate/guanylate cyclase domain-containing protein n=1 Tax=Inquilinus sp. CA228 TaxID=3455609 RepID=UPI003F8D127D
MIEPRPDAGLADLIEWLSSDECHDASNTEMLADLGRLLRALGLPIDRLSLHLRTLHPQILARTLAWTEGEPVELRDRDISIERLPFYATNPIRRATEGQAWLSLATPEEMAGMEELDFFQGRGLRAAIVAPLVMGQGPASAAVFATRRPEGFAPADRAAFERVVPALRGVCEIRLLRAAEATMLNTYVGPITGRRILDGHIRRGDVETLEAALLLCDLRDFTVLSNRLPPEQMLDRLNLYFDQIVPAITTGGGEVLKFMGDAVLAFFHLDDGAVASCAAAFGAARLALDRIHSVSQAGTPLSAGVALHHGEVAYGNIGSGGRLDFTVIGRDVNLVSRIQTACATTGEPLLMSPRFVALLGRPGCRSIGPHPLKGFAEPLELFAWSPE